ncbi:T9SS type A sorting domain-containing protein [Winogradskyella alexanderae]|uniref:T9SS type A sorting domain-containing protein n=1 Tax=Winogradskyella alexanderae TaxID=2877123 RepID=A0ABS7XPM8_9FLAO|nr:T9SS type A sorting domain-containing protein [Winogradskyella alexanderae]MCA0131408.1 T9SS type A sorting domain-containing protein [Winogradskyella alexanderae]
MTKITLTIKHFLACLVISSTALLGAQIGNPEPLTHTPSRPACELPPGEFVGLISIPRAPETAARMDANGTPCANFVVNYNGFTPEAQAAFQYAVDIWAHSIESSVPINISATFTPLGQGVLGAAGPATFLTVTSGAPGTQPNIFYPAALWEKIEGADRSPFGGSNDINADFSSGYFDGNGDFVPTNWYFGTDANPPANQFDFVSVVLHELGHGLGFSGGWANVTPSFPDDIGTVREPNNNIPAIYTAYIENGSGTDILSFADPSATLGSELTGNDLFCNAPTAIQQLGQGGTLPKIFAPSSWNPGSSFSHWDNATFPIGDVNSLMRSSISSGVANHNPGFITLGFFQDMGWSICAGALSVDEFSVANVTLSPNPFIDEITVTLNNSYSDSFELNLMDINGRLITSQTIDVSNGKLTLSNLNDLDDALYFIKITNSRTGSSITKKVVKN